jgi:DNA-binding NarL/FixJ family response regulator
MIRVLLVDDQQSVRRGLRMRLGLEPDLTVVGEAGDGEAALRMARLVAPDVVVMDVEMPRLDGIAATEQLLRAEPRCAVVVLSLHEDAVTRERAKAAGARGFVSKTRIDDCLLSAIRSAASPEAQPCECTDTA